MSIPNNRSGQGLPKRPSGQGKIPNRPPSGNLPNRSNNPSIPKKDELPGLPEFNTPSPRNEEDIVRSRTRNNVKPEGVRGKQSDEYNFNTGRAALGQKPSFRNEFDNEEDDTFEDLSIDEQLDYEAEEDQESRRREAKRKAAARRAEEEIARRRAERQAEREKTLDEEILFEDENEDLPDSFEDDEEDEKEEDHPAPKKEKKRKTPKDFTEDNVKDEYGQDVFVDEKNMKLKPFGSKKGKKKKTKEHEYDHRKNMRTNSTIARFVFLALFLFVVGLGVKNTFFPEPALSEEEITGIVSETADLTNYPVQRGGGFAQDFVQAYLSTDAEESSTNQSILNYFYTGQISTEDAAVTNRVISNDYSQTVLYGPTVYESEALTDYSARYTIGAVVRSNALNPENPANDAKWVFMNVNVYYDEDTDSFTITPDSPAILPNPPVGDATNLPTEMALGEETTDTEVIDKVQPVVYGFLNGYRQSSTNDHSTLDQYIVGDASTALEQGLNNRYEFAGGSVEDATEYLVYTDPEDPNLLKVKATVTWVDGTADNNVNFTSTYVLFLREQDNGMYLVERFQPFYFVADEEEMLAEQEEAAAEVETDAETVVEE